MIGKVPLITYDWLVIYLLYFNILTIKYTDNITSFLELDC